ncbi:hypothetical protein WJX72_004891 [[Myrmecia] bisecta]|uniref:Uncharacterized protein n=1 Tax=[Myrmecia] bisecta TaxID=41462 RepID=A0AAW1R6X6_9CHLO
MMPGRNGPVQASNASSEAACIAEVLRMYAFAQRQGTTSLTNGVLAYALSQIQGDIPASDAFLDFMRGQPEVAYEFLQDYKAGPARGAPPAYVASGRAGASTHPYPSRWQTDDDSMERDDSSESLSYHERWTGDVSQSRRSGRRSYSRSQSPDLMRSYAESY